MPGCGESRGFSQRTRGLGGEEFQIPVAPVPHALPEILARKLLTIRVGTLGFARPTYRVTSALISTFSPLVPTGTEGTTP